MSALTDLFTAMANKIRSKTGTATTYTPLQMVSDGIDDVYAAGYDAGGGGAAGIPITPSNASPVSLTTGDSYEMLADGYAISSYNNVTPSNSSPVSLSNNTIYKTGGAGVAIASYSSVTPSNASPVTLSSGSIYKMGGNGKAIESYSQLSPSAIGPTYAAQLSEGIYKINGNSALVGALTSIAPSDSSPVALSTDYSYRMNSAGYAIENQPETLTPNNTSPPSIASGTIYRGGGTGKAIASIATNGNGVTPSSSGQYFYSGWNRMTASGYACTSQPPKVAVGSATLSTSSTTTINLGFAPKYICYRTTNSNQSAYTVFVYDERFSTTKQQLTSINLSLSTENISGNTGANRISSITSTGFVVNKVSSSTYQYMYYFAIG